MGVRVDKTRRHDLSLGVDDVVGLAFRDVGLNGHNLFTLDQDVRLTRLGARSVIDQTALDEDGFLAGLRRDNRCEQQHERCKKNSFHICLLTFSYGYSAAFSGNDTLILYGTPFSTSVRPVYWVP